MTTLTATPPRAAQGRAGEAELLRALRRGDDHAFDVLVRDYGPRLRNFFARLTGEPASAEDLAQEAFLRFYLHRRNYQPRARLSTYLYRIGCNCWIDHLRRARRDRSLDAESDDGRSLAETLEVRAEDPRASSERDELADAVVEAIDRLPAEHKAVLLLSELEGLRYTQISAQLQLPLGTVKSRMFHAVRRLRGRLAG